MLAFPGPRPLRGSPPARGFGRGPHLRWMSGMWRRERCTGVQRVALSRHPLQPCRMDGHEAAGWRSGEAGGRSCARSTEGPGAGKQFGRRLETGRHGRHIDALSHTGRRIGMDRGQAIRCALGSHSFQARNLPRPPRLRSDAESSLPGPHSPNEWELGPAAAPAPPRIPAPLRGSGYREGSPGEADTSHGFREVLYPVLSCANVRHPPLGPHSFRVGMSFLAAATRFAWEITPELS